MAHRTLARSLLILLSAAACSPADTSTPGGGQPDGGGGHSDRDAGPLDGDANRPDGDAGRPDSDAPPLTCDEWTHERLRLTVTVPSGEIHDCSHALADGGFPQPLHGVYSGIVRGSSTDAGKSSNVTIDTCTNDVCSAQSALIDLETPTPFEVPIGAYVEAEYWIELSFGCTQFLRISNLPEWNGSRNPVSDIPKTYVVASEGLYAPGTKLTPTGIAGSAKALGCGAPDGGRCSTMRELGSYVFEFSANGSSTLTAPMGQSLPWSVGGQNVLVRNHRSYESGWCDDYWNWAFTIVAQ